MELDKWNVWKRLLTVGSAILIAQLINIDYIFVILVITISVGFRVRPSHN